jgi:hypothetical protein
MKTSTATFQKLSYSIVFSALIFLIFDCSAPDNREKILFIGNSFMYSNDLPSMFRSLAESKNKQVLVEDATHGYFTLLEHAHFELTGKYIGEKKWDDVILNENNRIIMDPARYETDLYPGIEKLAAQIKSKGGKRIGLFINWGARNGTTQPFDSFEAMQKKIIETTESASKKYNIDSIPIGIAWQKIHSLYPDINLWFRDNNHPTVFGSFIAACVVYSYIFKESPEGSSYTPPGISEQAAKDLERESYNAVSNYK